MGYNFVGILNAGYGGPTAPTLIRSVGTTNMNLGSDTLWIIGITSNFVSGVDSPHPTDDKGNVWTSLWKDTCPGHFQLAFNPALAAPPRVATTQLEVWGCKNPVTGPNLNIKVNAVSYTGTGWYPCVGATLYRFDGFNPRSYYFDGAVSTTDPHDYLTPPLPWPTSWTITNSNFSPQFNNEIIITFVSRMNSFPTEDFSGSLDFDGELTYDFGNGFGIVSAIWIQGVKQDIAANFSGSGPSMGIFSYWSGSGAVMITLGIISTRGLGGWKLEEC